ncbi:MAG: bifunctional folylpolyglutamate synthase/dihydrofolate synthase [Gammaproteobacteria bacterium]|nr:bifunctional folylpolyglutamate synthase/dihydrofolate synthase [Gammaproteobacteria bacterium]
MPKRFATLAEWLAWFETLHPKKIDMGLDRIRVVLENLGLREPPYRVVTVGGTNGKGSCVEILASVYREAGHTTGAFTSPHLWAFNERIRVDGREATDAELISLFEAVDDALGAVTLSYFESSAAAALLYFARRRVDVAVLEVGMGGRLDATNAVDADGALIASVDLDHQDYLGGDRETIGREKAGIMRSGRPVVVGDREPPQSVLEHARSIGAELEILGRDFDFRRENGSWTFEARGVPRHEGLPRVPFGGVVQYQNAACCVALVDRLDGVLPVGDAALARGLAGARLRGRADRHVLDGVEWVFDVAHNPAAAAAFRDIVGDLPPAPRTIAVFAAMHDKDHAGVLGRFVPTVDRWFVAGVDDERGAPADMLLDVLRRLGAERAEACADVAAACAAAARDARPGQRVLVFGSFYTVGPAMEALGLNLGLYSTPSEEGG